MVGSTLHGRPPPRAPWARFLGRNFDKETMQVEFKTDWDDSADVRQQRRGFFDCMVCAIRQVKSGRIEFQMIPQKRWIVQGLAACQEVLSNFTALGFTFSSADLQTFFRGSIPPISLPAAAAPVAVSYPRHHGQSQVAASNALQTLSPSNMRFHAQVPSHNVAKPDLRESYHPQMLPYIQASPLPQLPHVSHERNHSQISPQSSTQSYSKCSLQIPLFAQMLPPPQQRQVPHMPSRQSDPEISHQLEVRVLSNKNHTTNTEGIEQHCIQPFAATVHPAVSSTAHVGEDSGESMGWTPLILTSSSLPYPTPEAASNVSSQVAVTSDSTSFSSTPPMLAEVSVGGTPLILSSSSLSSPAPESARNANNQAALSSDSVSLAAPVQVEELPVQTQLILTSDASSSMPTVPAEESLGWIHNFKRTRPEAVVVQSRPNSSSPSSSSSSSAGEQTDSNTASTGQSTAVEGPAIGRDDANAEEIPPPRTPPPPPRSTTNVESSPTDARERNVPAEVEAPLEMPSSPQDAAIGAQSRVHAHSAQTADMQEPSPTDVREGIASNRKRPATPSAEETGEGTRECVICMDAVVNTVFVPCGHMATCADCGKKLGKKPCPVCRKKIKIVQKVYIAC